MNYDPTWDLPWPLICQLACKALIAKRSLADEIAVGMRSGMVRREEMRARYLHMKKTNRAAELLRSME